MMGPISSLPSVSERYFVKQQAAVELAHRRAETLSSNRPAAQDYVRHTNLRAWQRSSTGVAFRRQESSAVSPSCGLLARTWSSGGRIAQHERGDGRLSRGERANSLCAAYSSWSVAM
jgi:hypothetical protein